MFDAEVDGQRFKFGISGFLHQSNLLMFDRETDSLWQSAIGEPVVGELANSGLKLDLLPLSFTTWEDWLERHPGTSVLALEQGKRTSYLHPDNPNAQYEDYFSTTELWFLPYLTSDELEDKAVVYGVEIGNAATAYPIDVLMEAEVVNDRVGILDIVVTFDADSTLARSYERDGRTFRRVPGSRELLDDSGVLWVEGEDGLEAKDGSGAVLERVIGIESFWFGWFAFHSHSQIFRAK